MTSRPKVGGGIKDFVTTVLKPYQKSVTMGEGVSKFTKNCVTSFMDYPYF